MVLVVPADHRVKSDKKDKYPVREMKKMWNMNMTIMPIVIGALGTVTKGLIRWLGNNRTSGDHPNYYIIEIGQSWELGDTCCHSNSRERPSTNSQNAQGVDNNSAKLDNKLPQNVLNITWSHKLSRENQENMESRSDNRRKKLTWSKDPKRYFPRRCFITFTIHNCHDAT